MSTFGVVVDACVLVKASVRDTLIRAYGAGLYRLHWTDDILAEVERNLVADSLTTASGARRLVETFRTVLAEAQVSGYERLIASMTNDPKDRHVVAAAVAAGAQLIVTDNLRDFPDSALAGHAIEARNPDDFLVELFDLHDQELVDIVNVQASVLRNPPLSVEQVLDNLARDGAPTFAALVRKRLGAPRDP